MINNFELVTANVNNVESSEVENVCRIFIKEITSQYVDGDFSFVHTDGTRHADLGGKLVHQVHIGVEAQVARLIDDEARLVFTQTLF